MKHDWFRVLLIFFGIYYLLHLVDMLYWWFPVLCWALAVPVLWYKDGLVICMAFTFVHALVYVIMAGYWILGYTYQWFQTGRIVKNRLSALNKRLQAVDL